MTLERTADLCNYQYPKTEKISAVGLIYIKAEARPKGGVLMVTYVTLVKFTSEGPNSITDFGKAWDEAAERVAKLGCKILGAYGLLGPYDMMFIYEGLDQRCASKLPLSLASLEGGIQTETWTMIPLGEFVKLPEKLKE